MRLGHVDVARRRWRFAVVALNDSAPHVAAGRMGVCQPTAVMSSTSIPPSVPRNGPTETAVTAVTAADVARQSLTWDRSAL